MASGHQLGLLHQWRSDVACVFERDPAARNALEVLLTYPGVHAVLLHRLTNRLWLHGWRLSARFLAFLGRGATQIEIHPGATIGQRLFIDHGAGVVIGETAEIGDGVTLYHGVTLGGTTWGPGKRHPTLGDRVMVGAGAKVLGAVEVGAGARVGANSVVIGDVPAERTVVGIPAKVVRTPADEGTEEAGGVNLDHHLIPDPVGRVVADLLERVRTLEARQEPDAKPDQPTPDNPTPDTPPLPASRHSVATVAAGLERRRTSCGSR